MHAYLLDIFNNVILDDFSYIFSGMYTTAVLYLVVNVCEMVNGVS